MQIYLPIAEVVVNAFLLFGIGGVVGLLSGMFGVGGGFLITPALFFIGIPPSVAVSTGAVQVVASSVSAVMVHLKRRTVDFRMGTVMLLSGFVGSTIGIYVFKELERLGHINLFVEVCYTVLMGLIGTMMFQESLRAILRNRRAGKSGAPPRVIKRSHTKAQKWPLKVKFRTSGLYISILPPIMIGIVIGFLTTTLGVGGGFILVPAMIYLLGMNTKVVVGTSLYQVIFISCYAVMAHVLTSQSVDLVLAVLLTLGGVIGAQFGAMIGLKLKAEQLRILLAILVLLVGIKIFFGLVLEPADLFNLDIPGHAQ
ncbi:sulfite exporter TauE/SafE family protein [Acidimangrovimonas sediminis]|uniref:sulfite exporter TauE/SafE family protein n=1 Tax=Acidimangrovimonas sediminis TaxID=2056283 RepID=UPI000C8030A5|nr:sulfite exporter TauE/SafE family protein [Acidimangrovimonas sediminis]